MSAYDPKADIALILSERLTLTPAPHGRTPLGAYLKMSAGCDPQEWATRQLPSRV